MPTSNLVCGAKFHYNLSFFSQSPYTEQSWTKPDPITQRSQHSVYSSPGYTCAFCSRWYSSKKPVASLKICSRVLLKFLETKLISCAPNWPGHRGPLLYLLPRKSVNQHLEQRKSPGLYSDISGLFLGIVPTHFWLADTPTAHAQPFLYIGSTAHTMAPPAFCVCADFL